MERQVELNRQLSMNIKWKLFFPELTLGSITPNYSFKNKFNNFPQIIK